MLEIRQSCHCFISTMGFPVLVRQNFDVDQGLGFCSSLLAFVTCRCPHSHENHHLSASLEIWTENNIDLFPRIFLCLTHWGRVAHICVSKINIIGSDNGLSPGRLQAIIYLNQCWNIVNWTLRNKVQWNLNQKSYIFIKENTFQNIVWKIAAILSWPQCVKCVHQD